MMLRPPKSFELLEEVALFNLISRARPPRVLTALLLIRFVSLPSYLRRLKHRLPPTSAHTYSFFLTARRS